MNGAERPNFDREEAFRLLRQMRPEDLAVVLAQLDSVERHAVEQGVVPQGYGEGTFGWKGSGTGHAPPESTVVHPEGIPSEAALGEVHVSTGTATVRVTAYATTSWSIEAAPTGPASSDAVASLWDLVKPKSTEDMVSIARELRLLVITLVLLFGAEAATPTVLAALQDAFATAVDVVQEIAEDPDPPAED